MPYTNKIQMPYTNKIDMNMMMGAARMGNLDALPPVGLVFSWIVQTPDRIDRRTFPGSYRLQVESVVDFFLDRTDSR